MFGSDNFSDSIKQFGELYLKYDFYKYVKKQFEYILKEYLPFLTILIFVLILIRK